MMRQEKPTAWIAGAVVLATAFLLFVLELATAKALLPRFGGSPMVWTTCMLAYQALLLAGYAYAHGLARLGSVRRQAWVHLPLLLVATGVAFWRVRLSSFADGGVAAQPILDLILTLAGTIALPFIAIAATSPLVQHWQRDQRFVYTLYAVSNVGSFAGLLAYPFLIEPLCGMDLQFTLWAILFAGAAAGMAWLALNRQPHAPSPALTSAAPDGDRPAWRDRLLWVALPAGTSALLLAATNELCQDLAVFPFLWVVPLSLYLLSFTLTFRARPLDNLLAPAAVATLIGMGTVSLGMMLPVIVLIIAVAALVFLLCLAAHRELFRLRPAPQHLTSYYLWSAAGSVLGALVVNLLCPRLFPGYWEFPISIIALWVVLVVATALDPRGSLRVGDRRQAAVLLGIVLYLMINFIPEEMIARNIAHWPESWSVPLRMASALLAAALLWRLLRHRRAAQSAVWPRLLAGLVLFLMECWLLQRIRNDRADAAQVFRNFFGIVRLQEMLHAPSGLHLRQLTHGRTNHGFQYMNENLRRDPTAYHSPSSGIGLLLQALQDQRKAITIGVTGLGAGALAAYPRAEDRIVFYEINPLVVDCASGPGAFFTFVNDCPGRVEMVHGDARQSMQREWAAQGSRRFDALVLDAFSSDAIPTHLITREAIALGLAHLARQPGGVLAVNISNRYLDIEPVLADSARHFGLAAIVLDTNGDTPVRTRSIWVLMTRDPGIFQAPGIAAAARPLKDRSVAWTDTYSSPFALLKWWSTSARRIPILAPRQAESVSSSGLSPGQTPRSQPE